MEIYIDTIGPGWRGVTLILQQGRHSPTPLDPDRTSMSGIVERAVKANKGQPPIDVLLDFLAKAATLYRMLVPKLNLDLSTEFRNSAPDNGFEPWRLSNRKLDPPRADLAFHLTNDLRKLARTSCVDFSQTVRFISMLEQKRRELQAETGDPLCPVVLGGVLGAAIDEDTMSRIENADTIAIRDYEAVKLYVEQRHTKLTSRAAGKAIPKDSDKTVYGVDDAQVPSPVPVSAAWGGGCGGCAIHRASAIAAAEPSLASTYDPWSSSQDPCSCPPCAPEPPHRRSRPIARRATRSARPSINSKRSRRDSRLVSAARRHIAPFRTVGDIDGISAENSKPETVKQRRGAPDERSRNRP